MSGAHILGDVPGTMPDGDPVPRDGSLPVASVRSFGTAPFGIYVHVPFCRTRCGYCDFNTYTASELGAGVSPSTYPRAVIQELSLARKALGSADVPVRTVFFGGGTPTLLTPAQIGAILRAIGSEFGLAPEAEVTVEANPETVDPPVLSGLLAAGVNRISFGMQSSQSHVLAVLDRVHEPGRPASCARWARAAGFSHVSLDLIYGTPGESDDDWRRSLTAAIEAGPDHLSAYALIVEGGTRLAARVRRGELAPPDDDVLADRYLIADDMLSSAGYSWYEISNWAVSSDAAARCAHNALYWTGGDWWGAGPGAHSHVAGTRWWNVRHPAAYASRLTSGSSPAQAREVLSPESRAFENIMLSIRLASGCPVSAVSAAGLAYAERAVADGLIDPSAFARGQIVLTREGRLLADAVTRGLTE
jgi:putative oxygen-independent coproporphyrinogen III oxidase